MNKRSDNSVLIYDIDAAIDSMKKCIDPNETCEGCICRPCNERCTEMLMRIAVDYLEKNRTPCRKVYSRDMYDRFKWFKMMAEKFKK